MDGIKINGRRDEYAGVCPQLVFQIKEKVLTDLDIRRERMEYRSGCFFDRLLRRGAEVRGGVLREWSGTRILRAKSRMRESRTSGSVEGCGE